MRVSTGMLYDKGVRSIQQQTSSLLHTQQQVASGRRILSPSEDPVAAARALEVTQSKEINAQYAVNQGNARTTLGLSEGQLGDVGNLLIYVRERAVQAGNTVLADADRKAIAADLRAQFENLLGIANSADGTGQYLFSGYQGVTKPFSGSVDAGVSYAGDEGRRMLQVSSSRQIAVSDSGSDVFMRIRNGNGTFVAAAGAANTGGGLIDAGNVLNPQAVTGHNYTITFSVAAGATTYTVVDQSTQPAPTTVVSSTPYTSGSAINFDGISIGINGSPANGDTFTVAPSTSQSMFATLATLVQAIETPAGNSGGPTRLSNQIGAALTNLDQALDNVLRARASIGSRQSEIDALASASEDSSIQYSQALSRLQDLDYAQAISQLTREQSYLEAAQKSFLRVSGLSLFNYV
jgi:flagellar hook-associated protein 3 FlgL